MLSLKLLPRSFPTSVETSLEMAPVNHPPTAHPPSVGIATSPAIVGEIANNAFVTSVPANSPPLRLPNPRAQLPPVSPPSVVLPSRTLTHPSEAVLWMEHPRLHPFRPHDLLHLLIMLTLTTSFGIGSRARSSTPWPTPPFLIFTMTSTTTSHMPRLRSWLYPP